MKNLGIIVAAVLTIVAVGGLVIAMDLGGLAYKRNTAEVRGASNAEHKIESSVSRISNYNLFFDLCSSVQKKEDAIDILNANDTMSKSQRSMALAANQTQRSNMISEYNSASAKDYTAARFKDSNLPFNLSRDLYDGQNKTNCFAQ